MIIGIYMFVKTQESRYLGGWSCVLLGTVLASLVSEHVSPFINGSLSRIPGNWFFGFLCVLEIYWVSN